MVDISKWFPRPGNVSYRRGLFIMGNIKGLLMTVGAVVAGLYIAKKLGVI